MLTPYSVNTYCAFTVHWLCLCCEITDQAEFPGERFGSGSWGIEI